MNTINLTQTPNGTWATSVKPSKVNKATVRKPVSKKVSTKKPLISTKVKLTVISCITGSYPILLALEWIFIG